MICAIEPGERQRVSATTKGADHVNIAHGTCALYGFEAREPLMVSRLKTPLDPAYMATRVEMHFSNVFMARRRSCLRD